MESLSYSQRRLPKEDIFAGVGGAVLAHALIFALAFVMPWAMPRQTLQGSAYTVNLVSMQDIGLDPAGPKKGTPTGSVGAAKSESARKSSAPARPKSSPVVPVKRLQMAEAAVKTEPEIKKLEAPEIPRSSEKPQNAVSVEKDLDKLIPKPKIQPKPAPIAQVAKEPASKGSQGSPDDRKAAEKPAAAASSEGTPKGAGVAVAKGTPEGDAKGSAEGGAKGAAGAGTAGSPDGAQIALARRAYYMALWNAIRQQWSLPEFLKAQKELEAVLVVVVRRDGKVLNLYFEKQSGQPIFDESVTRAVRKAEPLPPFPAIYSVSQEEIGLRFSPKDIS